MLTTQTDEGSRRRTFDAESCDAAAAGVAFILAITENPAVVADRSVAAPPSALESLPPLPTPGQSPVPVDARPAPEASVTTGQKSAPNGTVAPESKSPAPAPVADDAAPAAAIALLEAGEGEDESRARATGRPRGGRAFDGVVAVGLGTDGSTLPRPTLGPVASAGLALGSWRFDLTGAYWTSQSATLPGSPTGARFDAWSAEARAAHGWPLGPFVVGPLAGLGLESIYAAGFGGTGANYDVSALTGTLGGGGFASWRPGGAMALRFEVEGEVPFDHPSFDVSAALSPNSLVFRLPAATARAVIGADVAF